MGILTGKDEPLHYGEIFYVWQCSLMTKAAISSYQAFLNHAGDHDLKKIIEDFINQSKKEMKQCDDVLMENGIAPPPVLPERPKVNLEDIPVGARFSDLEIAASVASSASLGLVSASQAMGMSINENIGAMFAKFHSEMTVLGNRILNLNKEKGWIVPPPLQLKKPELVEA
ncbi:DUF3231 family protein [Paenibacillus crassostreae]|uniref:DUF3231 family protein n=1 Tax=Paenibacillus crassostreae TaxID=1763538 RepID=A0A167C1B3_9BACL|nr:DUF3231 family protein [Paenibacillus crassostreae]AOZ91765.1 hypothetical protein LPB68_05705 [Paenibacillus crassostreae]OAB72662.1 hypothetical protein PNBC_14545 [Paenibacillus crassostreae]